MTPQQVKTHVAAGVAGAGIILAALVGVTAVSGTSQTIHIIPGDQVTIIADAAPTPSPTATPSPTPTLAPTPSPTPKPTPSPTATPVGTPIANLQNALNATAAGGTLDGGNQSYGVTHLSIPANVTLANAKITYTGSAGAAQTGMIDLNSGSKIINVTAVGGPYSVVRAWVGASNASIINSDISAGPKLGVIAYQANNLTISGGRIHDNNPGGGQEGYEAGGVKIGNSSGYNFTGIEVDHNRGPGLWEDVSCTNGKMTGNRVHDNTYAGLMAEIGQNVTISGNLAWENGWGDSRGGIWSADILVSSSGHATVTNNTVAWAQEGISFISQNRGVTTAGNSATNNFVAVSSGRTTVGTFKDWSDPSAAPVVAPNAVATSTQLAAAGIPTAPQAGH